jgi:hypothetical protein
VKIHLPAPTDGDPHELFVITPKGAWRPRCPAIFNGRKCLKKSVHVSKGDAVHSDGVFVWGEGSRGYRVDWENDLPVPPVANTDELATAETYFGLAGRSTSAAQELAHWWRTTAEAEIEQTVAKAIEYGATDLIDIGRSLARVAGQELDDQQAAEWGVFFYLEGKLSRWRSAMERGDVPSFDTLLDIGVYARMAQRIRMTGGWPGTEVEHPIKQQTYGEDTE